MNEALDYIESHLDDEIDDSELEKITGTSVYHFRRLFSFLSGMTLGAYIRNRKLSNATYDLLRDDVSVTDTAFKYGYESVDGFSRAFREWAGLSPSEVKKKQKQMLKTFPKLSFQLTIRGGVNMNFRVEDKEPFKVVGVKKKVPIQFEGINKEIEKLVESITDEQYEALYSYVNIEPHQVINASYNFDGDIREEKGYLDHMIGILTTKEGPFDEFEVLEIPSHTWAIFFSEGAFPQVMQDTWAKIGSEWLPSSNYELVEAPEISFVKDFSNLDDVYSEIWIAVKKRDSV